jgi:TonB-dependent SusC/RagA subfamily outer membrane receptor
MLFKTLLFSLLALSAFAQTGSLRGKITDRRTGEPLPFANVYINRTTLGTATTIDGDFIITNITAGSVELISSLVGYETGKITLIVRSGETKVVNITLKPTETQLSEVTVTAKKDKRWLKDLEEFTKGFVGKDEIAKHCIIQNAEVLEFEHMKGNGLEATASEPLVLINNSLGYQVTYELVHFKLFPTSYLIAGNIKFELLDTSDSTLMQRWIINREKVYRLSPRNFYRAFVTNRLAENGYEVYQEKTYEEDLKRADLFSYVKPYLEKLEPSGHIFLTDSGTFLIDVRTRIEIHDRKNTHGKNYRDVRYPVSWIELSRPLIISPQGIPQNPLAVQYLGAMSDLRVAHLLPENYIPQELSVKIDKAVKENALATLTESIFVHTDKDYYYPGEPVWLKGYMRYGTTDLLDSMSRTVYVELIDSQKLVIGRKIFPIENGTFDGRIDIPSTAFDGVYAMRAYTNWMRNFGETNFFSKALPVINPYERLVSRPNQKQSSPYSLNITADSAGYHVGDSIHFLFEIRNSENDPVSADISMSITDVELVAEMPGNFQLKNQIDTSAFRYKYPIEKGISLVGKVTNGKKTISQPLTVTAVLGKFDDLNTFETQRNGKFFLTGFHFYDSSGIALQATDSKGKPFGAFELDKQTAPPITKFPDAPAYTVQRARSPITRYADYEAGAIQLKEVTVTGKREKQKKDMYTSGEYAISGDNIRSAKPNNLLNLFERGRVPRVRVRSMVDAMGMMRSVLSIPGMGVRSGEPPLLVIDGVPFDTQQDLGSVINQVNINDVERIEVLTSSASIYGVRAAGGVVVITTKTQDGKYGSNNPNEFSTVDFSTFPFYGYTNFKPFRQRDPKTQSADGITTIYWNPYLSASGTAKTPLSFLASSSASKYRIVVRGITIDGEIFTAEAILKAK